MKQNKNKNKNKQFKNDVSLKGEVIKYPLIEKNFR